MAEKHSKAVYLFVLIPVFMFGAVSGFLGFVNHNSNLLTGFLWGICIGVGVLAVSAIGFFGWEWIKKEADQGKMRPYMLSGIVAAVVISAFLATSLGSPTCDEQSDDPVRTGCVSYADDGFQATSEQRWEEFWRKIPITIIVCLLIAYVVYSQVEKSRPRRFKSEKDEFTVGLFPETVSVDIDDDGNHYKYIPYEGIHYAVDVTPLDELPAGKDQLYKIIKLWHKNIIIAATGISDKDVKYSDGKKSRTQYVYGSYPLKKDVTYYHLTLTKHRKIYSLSMYIHSRDHENTTIGNKIFFEFVDSFKFINDK